jgi:DNA processing protein
LPLSGARLPARLADLPDPPRELLIHGELPRGPAVAIVGTRFPTPDGARYTRHLAGVLAREGVTILSGGAVGIDTAAHRGALDVGGSTVVVAPAGFARAFPPENRELFSEIVERGGAYVSATDESASRGSFFLRNRILAALCHALVMTEAPNRSGARNATKHARELSRAVFVVLQPPWNARGGGAVTELALGARPLSGPRDVLRELVLLRQYPLPLSTSGDPVPMPWLDGPAPRTPVVTTRDLDSLRVVRAVEGGARTTREIAERTHLAGDRVALAILTLTENGVLVPGPSGHVFALSARER